MMKFIWKWFGLSKLKNLLDRLPANGRKTIVGAIIVLLSVAASFFPEYADILRATIEYLRLSFATEPVLTTGAITAAIGLIHKILKALEVLLKHAEKK